MAKEGGEHVRHVIESVERGSAAYRHGLRAGDALISLNGEAIVDSMSFTRLLLEDSKVAVVPGIGFGADSFVRLSYATNMANIEKGLSRIADFVSRLTD